MISDPRCNDNVARVANRKLVNGAISEWLTKLPDRDAATAALREARIPNAPVLTVEEAMNHPHLIERGTVRTVHDRVIGEFKIPGFPLRFSAFPQPLELQAPLLGEHNRHVLGKYLGFPGDEIARLERDGILRSAPH